jgi:hypothetical protein
MKKKSIVSSAMLLGVMLLVVVFALSTGVSAQANNVATVGNLAVVASTSNDNVDGQNDDLNDTDAPEVQEPAVQNQVAQDFSALAPATLHGLGDGTAANPIVISNAHQLALLAYLVDKGGNALAKDVLGADSVVNDDVLHIVLGNDINLAELYGTGSTWTSPNGHTLTGWSPIGTYSHNFDSNFDGRGHSVFGLKIDNQNSEYSVYGGLFGYVGQLANISNLSVFGCISAHSVTSGVYVGGLAGYSKGAITGVAVTVNINATSSDGYAYVGGVAGKNTGTIVGASAFGTVTSQVSDAGHSAYAGGIAGVATGGIYNANSAVVVASTSNAHAWSYAGGIAGRTTSVISSSVANSDVSATSKLHYAAYAGGIVGHLSGSVMDCVAYGKVVSSTLSKSYAGGIAAYALGGSIVKAFATNSEVDANGTITFVHRIIGADNGTTLDLNNASKCVKLVDNGKADTVSASASASSVDGLTIS